MNKTQKIVKVNADNAISILTWEDGTFEVAHLFQGEPTYSIWNDVQTFKSENEMEEAVQELASQIVARELDQKGWDATPEVDAQVIVETFTYNVWIAVSYYGGELSYSVSTTREDDREESWTDRNCVERKTWKGLMNYLKRFDK